MHLKHLQEVWVGLTADDSLVNTVVPLDAQYLWSDKYRPRKPRVFNKVHTVCIDLFIR